MDFFLTPTTLIQFFTLLALIGLGYMAYEAKRYKLLAGLIALSILLVIAPPVRKGVSDRSFQNMDAHSFDRHQNLPDKVNVEKQTFDEVMENKGQQIKHDNNKTRMEILKNAE